MAQDPRKPNFKHGDIVRKFGVTGKVVKVLTVKEKLHVEDRRGDLHIWIDDQEIELIEKFVRPPSPSQVKREKRKAEAERAAARSAAEGLIARDKLKRSLEQIGTRVNGAA